MVAASAWVVAAAIGPAPPQPVSAGLITATVTLLTDVSPGRFGAWALARHGEAVLLLDFGEVIPELSIGDRAEVSGTVDGKPGTFRGRAYSSKATVSESTFLAASTSPVIRLGDEMRDRVTKTLQPFAPGRALLAGFLIGDTSELGDHDVEAMRLAGLSHFVAVSGSNVALFLGLLALVAGPLGWGPRRRSILGLIGLPVYAAATRFEPSVLRASLMAGLALAGKLAGVVFEAWQLIALAVIVLVIGDPGLTGSVGFQLSVAATAGVLVAARWPTADTMLLKALVISLGAQAAVAPLLLTHFGSIPLFSPLANVIAAPLVALATVLGAVGVLGVPILVNLGGWVAELVLHLARGAAVWPQISLLPAMAVAVAVFVFVRWPATRLWVTTAAASWIVVALLALTPRLPDPGVVVLDVGQGDAILVHGGGGRFALIDGGPDPGLLLGALRRYGVTAIELLALSHVHADHATGLVPVPATMAVGVIWAALDPHHSSASEEFVQAVEHAGLEITVPSIGSTYRLGEVELEVLGPLRRYASPNDQSLVILVAGPGRTMLLAGDIETVAQAELPGLEADVLKVPHQGAATSDPVWLVDVGADTAVISVGPNDFGHPAPWVIEVLEEGGARVLRTDLHGDVVVPLS